MNRVTVLVTGMGSTTAISVVKSLRKQQSFAATVIGADVNDGGAIAGSFFCDEFFRVPWAKDPVYVDSLLEICRRRSVDILIPIVDPELLAVAEAYDLFVANRTLPIVSSANTVRKCNDKYETFRFFREHGIATPDTWKAEDVDFRRARFPLIVKPIDGVSSVGVTRVDDAVALEHALNNTPRAIVQDFLPGPEFTIDVVSTADQTPIVAVPRERLETKAGISSKGRTVRNERMIERAMYIARQLRIVGPCNIQCRVPSHEPVFFEVNPRFSGSLPLTVAAGVNPVEISVLSTLGRLEQRYWSFKSGVTMARYWEEVFRDEEQNAR